MSKKAKKLSKKDSRKLEIDKFKSHVLEASDTYGKDPSLVTLSEFNEFSDFSEWDLRKLGGFGNLKKLLFPMEEKDVSFERESAKARSYISKLEKELGDKISLENEIRESIVKNIKPVKVNSYKPKTKKVTKTRDVVAMLNDTHIGLIVKPEEVNNLNKFDFVIASRRIGFFIDEVCKYKLSKRDEVGTLHLLLNGDLIAGIIHGLQGRDLEMLTHQFNGAVHIFTNAVSRVAENFKNVKVYFSTGNHGDSPHRREGSRVLSQIYDSIEGQLFYAVSAAHRQTKNVQFEAGHTLYQDIKLPAGRAIMTHGHLMFSSALGNPGTTVNSKSLGVALSDFNSGERRQGREEVKLVLVGHTHSHFHITTREGVQVYNAPSLSGIDSFAYSIGINYNLTGQVMFESTKDYILGDSRLLHVSSADDNPEYDKVIPVYKKELVYKS